jgi:hypothetical protein
VPNAETVEAMKAARRGDIVAAGKSGDISPSQLAQLKAEAELFLPRGPGQQTAAAS